MHKNKRGFKPLFCTNFKKCLRNLFFINVIIISKIEQYNSYIRRKKLFIELIIFLCIYLIIYFKFLKTRDKTEILKVSVTYLYLVSVLCVTILPIDFTLDPKWKYHDSIKVTYIHVKPFNDLVMGYRGAQKEIILNVIMTIPFGFLCCVLKKNSSIIGVTFKTFLLSFGIEFMQLIMTIFLLHHRSCDVTDLFTNVIGGIIGFVLYKLTRKILNKLYGRVIFLWTKK